MADPESLLTSPGFMEVLDALGLNTVDKDAFQMLEDARQQVVLGELSMEEYEKLKDAVTQQLKEAAQQVGSGGGNGEGGSGGGGGGGVLGGGLIGRATVANAKRAEPEVPENEKPILSSELWKAPIARGQEPTNTKKFQKRHVVLYKSCLCYFKKSGDTQPLGRVDWTPDFFVQDSDAHENGFVVSDMNTTITLAADSADLKGYWMHMLLTVLRKVQEDAKAIADGREPAPMQPIEEIKALYDKRMEEFKKTKQDRRRSMFFRKKQAQEQGLKDEAANMATSAMRQEMEERERKRQEELEKMEQKLDSVEKEAEKYKTEAEKERERAEMEKARAEEEQKKAEEAERKAEMSFEQWQAEAREKELKMKAEYDELKEQLEKKEEEGKSKRRLSMMPGSEVQFDIEKYEKERKELQAKLDALSKAMDVDMNSLDWDGSLEDAEAKMKDLVPALCSEDPQEAQEAQVLFDKWDKIIRNHSDYHKREQEKWKSWEEENKEKNQEALKEMKKIVPHEIVSTGVHKEFLKGRGLSDAVANRVMTTKIFQFYYMDQKTIAKLHIADLSSRYVPQGLDIVELRAVYASLPEEFELDPDGRKAVWREQARAKLHQLTEKEKKGELARHEARHPAYRPKEEKKAAPKAAPGPKGKARGAAANKLAAALAGRGQGPPRGPPGGGRGGGGGGDEDGDDEGGKKPGGLDPSALQNALQNKMKARGGPPPKVVQESAAESKKEEKKKDADNLLGVLNKSKAKKSAAGETQEAAETAKKEDAEATKKGAAAAEAQMNGNAGAGAGSGSGSGGSGSASKASNSSTPPKKSSGTANGAPAAATGEAEPRRKTSIFGRKSSKSPSSRASQTAGGAASNGSQKPADGKEGSTAKKNSMAARFEASTQKKTEEKKERPAMVDIGVKFNAAENGEESSDATGAANGGADTGQQEGGREASESKGLLSKDVSELMAKVRANTSADFDGDVQTYDFMAREEERKKQATWVDDGITRVIKTIMEHGAKDEKEGGQATITFGSLYENYGEGSDKLVGILMRAKKKKKLRYVGDMLFKGVHDSVKITVL